VSLIKLASSKTQYQLSEETKNLVHSSIKQNESAPNKYNKLLKILPNGIDIKMN